MPYYYYDDVLGYEVATDPIPGRTEVTPRPRHDIKMRHDGTQWVEILPGFVMTDEFLAVVFAPPAGMMNPPADYAWNRENLIRMISPATGERMKKGEKLRGTRAEIEQIAGWMLTNAVTPNTYPPEFVPAVQDAGTGAWSGGIISQEEYARAIALLNARGVV